MKNSRQDLIVEIINTMDIETQEQLLAELAKRDIHTTQATISRDIKQLRLVKQAGPHGMMRYVASAFHDNPCLNVKLEKIFRECVTHFDCAQNLVVIKTMPGLASAACSAVDKMNLKSIVGSIAGDDTLFIAMRDNAAAEAFCEEIKSQIS